MKASKSLKLAVNILRHSKLRSWLTIVGIVIGVAAVVAIISIGEGMQQSIEERLGGLGSDIITITPGASRASGMFMRPGGGGDMRVGSSLSDDAAGLTENDVRVLKGIDNAEYIQGTISGRAELYYLGETVTASVDGVDPLVWSHITTSELDQGRFLGASDYAAVVVGSRIANDVFKQSLPLNRVISIDGTNFKIVGILKESGSGFGGGGGDASVIMPIEAARSILDKEGKDVDSITVKVADETMIDDTMDAIDQKLMLFRHVTDRTKDYTLTSSKSTQETISSTMETMTLFLGAIAAVSLLVGAVGIANTMFTTVLEKTKEIGIMKAIGAKNRDIMMIFMLNSALVGLVGGALGVILGTFASGLMGSTSMTTTGGGAFGGMGSIFSNTLVTPSLVFYAMLIAVGIGMVAGLVPAYRASRLRPVDALRYE